MRYREAIIAEALRWEYTPFHRGALLCGIGGDCFSIMWSIYRDHLGVTPWEPYGVPPAPYDCLFSGQWEWHFSEELLLNAIRAYMPALREIPVVDAQPGDVVSTGAPGQPANHLAYLLPDNLILHARLDPRRQTHGATIMRERRHPAFERTIRTAFVLEGR